MALTQDLLNLITTLFANNCFLDPGNSYQHLYGANLYNNFVFDFIVVGAGSSGSAIAARLAEFNPQWTVLLVEAGNFPKAENEYIDGWPKLIGSEGDWTYTSEPSTTSCLSNVDKKCWLPRGKVFGGSSALFYPTYLRGIPKDYDEWESNGNPGWNWNSVLHYFKKLENVIGRNNGNYGTDGPVTVADITSNSNMIGTLFNSITESGYTVHDDEVPLGAYRYLNRIEGGTRCSASRAYLAKSDFRPNLYISRETRADKILIQNKRANGVVVTTKWESFTVLSRREVILSAGAYNSPKLLMLSGIGPATHLSNMNINLVQNLPVGQNLQDHFHTYGQIVRIDPQPYNIDYAQEALNFCVNRKGILAGENRINIAWSVNTNNEETSDVQINPHYIPKDSEALIRRIYAISGLPAVTIESIVELNKNYDLLDYHLILTRPESRGLVRLRSSNPADKPVIHTNYLSDLANRDIANIYYSAQVVNGTLYSPTMLKLNAKYAKLNIPNCNEFILESFEYWSCVFRNTGGSGNNPGGTCKMGPRTDPNAVVDYRLRVHGISGLRVVDASIMPRIPNRNSNGPEIMIGEKGADMIIADN